MIEIDGGQGEGGGQILRTALTLSMATGKPFRISGIRAGRRRPGMMRQHLTCVEASATISDAELDGARIGSTTLTFKPHAVKPGEYSFTIASAGSSTLVFQTVAPVLLQQKAPSQIHFEGGTHNSAAPCYDFIEKTFMPALQRCGVTSLSKLSRRGYYPAGGGIWDIELQPPSQFSSLDLSKQVSWGNPEVRILLAKMSLGLVDREKKIMAPMLGLSETEIELEEDHASIGPGNVILITIKSLGLTEIITGFAGFGGHTEDVSTKAAIETLEIKRSGLPVGVHLADQLMVPLALFAGGQYLTMPLTSHSQTNLKIIETFLPGAITVEVEQDRTLVKVRDFSSK